MTPSISMPDSVRVGDLPAGYPAYLGYADGDEPTAGALAARFPHANRVILTVTGNTVDCDGIDCEPGNVSAAVAAAWALDKLRADPRSYPIIYASVIGKLGYGMPEVISELVRLNVSLVTVRLLSAHYGAGPHICGPKSCGLISRDMDGTQWTNNFVPLSNYTGPVIDMSQLAPDFFTRLTGGNGTEKIVQELGTVRQGATGETVRTVQGLLLARGYAIGVSGVLTAGVDGVFGPLTLAAVRQLQDKAHLTADGVVGPLTWPVLLGVA